MELNSKFNYFSLLFYNSSVRYSYTKKIQNPRDSVSILHKHIFRK